MAKIVILKTNENFNNVLRYLHYHVPSEYERSLVRTESEVAEPLFCVSEPCFEWNQISFTIHIENAYRKQYGYFDKYSELIIEHDSITVIIDFIQTCYDYINKQLFRTPDKLYIFKSDYCHWIMDTSDFKERPFDKVYLPKKIKNELISDITTFYDPKVVNRYSELNINHVRIYLFYGPPGTGKTTTIKSIASHFKKNICYLSMEKDLMDSSFKKVISLVPNNSIVCIEDIDSVFGENRKMTNDLSFSNVINVFDGLSTPKNMVLFMTTNHIQHLENAVVRRIGYFVKFDYATKEQIKDMFATFFPGSDFNSFYSNVGDSKVSINIVEKFFIKHLFDDIVEVSSQFSKFANSELKVELDSVSKLYT